METLARPGLLPTAMLSQGEMDLSAVTSGTSATWVGEIEQRPETTLTIGLNALVLHELACYIDASTRLLDNAAVNIEELLSEDLVGAFASAMNAAILVGNGVKKPQGLLTGIPGVVRVPSGSATTILSDGLIDLTTAIPAQLLQAPCFVMNWILVGQQSRQVTLVREIAGPIERRRDLGNSRERHCAAILSWLGEVGLDGHYCRGVLVLGRRR